MAERTDGKSQTTDDSDRGAGGRPQPISTLPRVPGLRFIGLILEDDTEGKPMWDIDHYQFVSGETLINLNSSNYTTVLNLLTHWMPEPEFM